MAEYIEREVTCRDCICYEICFVVRNNGDGRILKNSPCKHFKNKADVVEVRHGTWLDVPYPNNPNWKPRKKCSVCGRVVRRKTEKYCPDCGAKMDGKGDNNE